MIGRLARAVFAAAGGIALGVILVFRAAHAADANLTDPWEA